MSKTLTYRNTIVECYPRTLDADGRLEIYLDASSLQSDVSCKRRFQFTNILGLRSKRSKAYSVYGSALHAVVASRYKNPEKELFDHLCVGLDYFNEYAPEATEDLNAAFDQAHFIAVAKKYLGKYVNDPFHPFELADGGKSVEMFFAIKLVENKKVVVYLCGALDAVGDYDGMRVILDLKSTSTVHSKHQQEIFFKNYERKLQMYIYSFAACRLGFTDYYLPVIIDGVFLKKDPPFASLQRSHVIDINQQTMEHMLTFLQYQASEIMHIISNGNEFQRNPSQCDGLYGGCPYKDICWGYPSSKLSAMSEFMQAKYDPKNFGNVQLSEIKNIETFKQFLIYV